MPIRFCVSAELDLNLILLEKDALAICAITRRVKSLLRYP